ncbi:MAG: hypothetical protein NVSMB44_14370 [Ktedonobacteraceae bacterium]
MDFSRAWQTIIDIGNGIIAGLPNFVLALILFGIFYVIARRVRQLVTYMTERRQRAKNLGVMAQGGVIAVGLLVSLTILFPSFKPSDLIQLLGIGSVAKRQ